MSAVPMSVVAATAVRDSGMESTGSRLSGYTSEFYDDNPWAEDGPSRRNTIPHLDDPAGKNNNLRLSLSGPLTSLQGPCGTSGKNPRRLDRRM